ncbi:AAA family ATPase [Allorhizocola rhizosphaerae]|uniref:AAA family ATPase n=1 Tax=Allorhizocola rhizosphaerae TaxID=1872709 RepID=UPI001FE9E22B|nr:AAA family ATPase [Allorhizocola rhizosphaerae]
MRTGSGKSQGFLRWIELADDAPISGYPFGLPVVQALRAVGQIDLHPQVTFFVGENGTGKSTLIEALAVACGFNPEGGSANFRFATRASESALGEHLRVVKAIRKPKTGFFLRAESFYNVATEVERLDREPYGPSLLPAYGGISLHERSHGESFLSLAMHRFRPNGLYLLDEPEAALSVHGCLALLARIAQLAAAGSQFVIATHSPVLIALPSAQILQIGGDGGIAPVAFDDAEPVMLMRSFLADPRPFLRHLLPET